MCVCVGGGGGYCEGICARTGHGRRVRRDRKTMRDRVQACKERVSSWCIVRACDTDERCDIPPKANGAHNLQATDARAKSLSVHAKTAPKIQSVLHGAGLAPQKGRGAAKEAQAAAAGRGQLPIVDNLVRGTTPGKSIVCGLVHFGKSMSVDYCSSTNRSMVHIAQAHEYARVFPSVENAQRRVTYVIFEHEDHTQRHRHIYIGVKAVD